MKKIACLLLIIVFVSSCSVKKRNYRKGYYIDWVFKAKNNKVDDKVKQVVVVPNEKKLKKQEALKPELEFASTTNYLNAQIAYLPTKKLVLSDTCGDIINLHNGITIVAKVIEITETQIKYKRCNNIDGPLFVANKNDVYSIKYTNGNTDHFIKTSETDNSRSVGNPNGAAKKHEGEKKVHPLAYVTLGCAISIIFISIFGLLATLIFAAIAKRKIMAEPDKYGGLQLVKVCQTICYVLLALAVLLILLFLSLM